VTLAEYKAKKSLTYQQLAKSFGVTIDKIFRWARDGAIIKRVNKKRCIFLTKKMAEEI